MIGTPFELTHEDTNPLDMVEDLAQEKGWRFLRAEENFLTVSAKGTKNDFEICLEWQEEFSALLVACSVPVEISDAHYETAVKTLERINQNIWLGHFDLSNKGRFPTFRHTLLFRMIPAGIAIDIINDVLDIAVGECTRFYSTFQLLHAGDVQLQDNLQAVIFETVGEA